MDYFIEGLIYFVLGPIFLAWVWCHWCFYPAVAGMPHEAQLKDIFLVRFLSLQYLRRRSGAKVESPSKEALEWHFLS